MCVDDSPIERVCSLEDMYGNENNAQPNIAEGQDMAGNNATPRHEQEKETRYH